MKITLSFLFVLLSFISIAQVDEYYRKVDWKFYPENVTQLTDTTYQIEAIPFDYNDPGSINRIVGNYVVDFVGHRYEVIDSSLTTITIRDIYHIGQAPQTGQIARCYRSVGWGKAEFIGSVDYFPLDESARWKLNGSDNELMWRQKQDTMPFHSVLFETGVTNLDWDAGTLYFDSARNNLVFYDFNSEVALDIGKELWIDVYNNSGELIPDGAAVYLDRENTAIPTVILAKANSPITSRSIIGIATHDIEHGTIGRVTTNGLVRNLNTSNLDAGSTIYLSPTVRGGLTTNRPVFPYYIIILGQCLRSHPTEGLIAVNVKGTIADIFVNAWNGTFLENYNFTVSSNGSLVTGYLSGDITPDFLTMNFSDGLLLLDVSPAQTVPLIPGTDSIPQLQYVYIPKSTKQLTVSTSFWPTEEHIAVAKIVLQSAAKTYTDGALRNQNFNDNVANYYGQGHVPNMALRIRKESARWESGTEGSVLIESAPTPDNVYVNVTGGKVWQLFIHDFPAQYMQFGADIHIANHPTNRYSTVYNLNTQTIDALGTSLSSRYFSFVIWGVVNKEGQISHLMLNLPTGSYNAAALATEDANNYSVYTIPQLFEGSGFLISRFTFHLSPSGGGTWTLIGSQDLRGTLPNTTAGGGGGGVTTFDGLYDTPSSKLGQANKLVKVGAAETDLEYTTITANAGALSNITTIDASGVITALDGSSTLWNEAYSKRINSLTTNGNSGVSTLINNVLNIPDYSPENVVNSYVGKDTVTTSYYSFSFPEPFNTENYYLSLNVYYDEESGGKNLRIENGIYNFTKSVNGFSFYVNNVAGFVEYFAADTTNLFPLEFVNYVSKDDSLTIFVTPKQLKDSLDSFTAVEIDPIFNSHTSNNIFNGTGFLKNNGTGTWSYEDANKTSYSWSSNINNSLQYNLNGTNINTAGTLTNVAYKGTLTDGYILYYQNSSTALQNSSIFYNGANIGIGTTSPTAKLHLAAGTTVASTSPLKLTSGSLMTTPEVGAIEFLTDAYYGTITTGIARKQFAFTTDIPDVSVYKLKSDSTATDGYTRRDRLTSSLATKEPANANIQSHISSTSNPHTVTATQVGLGNVTNESKVTMFTSPTFTGTTKIVDANTTITRDGSNNLVFTDAVTGAKTLAQLASFNVINVTSTLSSNLTYSGIIETITVGENVVFGDVLYLKFSDGKWWKAKADAYATTPVARMALATISANNAGLSLIEGNVRYDSWSLAANKIYLSAATSGAVTTTQPATTGNQIQVVGTAKTSTTMYFKPSQDVGEK